MLLRRLPALVYTIVWFATVAAPVGAVARTMRPDDLRRIVGVSSPTIAPDGSRVAVVVTRIVWNTDKYARDLDLIDTETHARRTLTFQREGLSGPRFSPDGKQLAFMAALGTGDDAHSQVWVMPLDGGDARPVTNAPEGVEQFAWSADGSKIAYAAEIRNRRKRVRRNSKIASSSRRSPSPREKSLGPFTSS